MMVKLPCDACQTSLWFLSNFLVVLVKPCVLSSKLGSKFSSNKFIFFSSCVCIKIFKSLRMCTRTAPRLSLLMRLLINLVMVNQICGMKLVMSKTTKPGENKPSETGKLVSLKLISRSTNLLDMSFTLISIYYTKVKFARAIKYSGLVSLTSGSSFYQSISSCVEPKLGQLDGAGREGGGAGQLWGGEASEQKLLLVHGVVQLSLELYVFLFC